MIKKRLYFRI